MDLSNISPPTHTHTQLFLGSNCLYGLSPNFSILCSLSLRNQVRERGFLRAVVCHQTSCPPLLSIFFLYMLFCQLCACTESGFFPPFSARVLLYLMVTSVFPTCFSGFLQAPLMYSENTWEKIVGKLKWVTTPGRGNTTNTTYVKKPNDKEADSAVINKKLCSGKSNKELCTILKAKKMYRGIIFLWTRTHCTCIWW